ncbi:MAG: methyltransferase domain-containing protein [Nanoarchaeota archaeon]
MKKLNFGCGKKIIKGWINVDIQKGKGIDKSFNFNKMPYPFKKDIFDYILLDNVLEHLEDPIKVLNELHRICKKDAIIKIIVPHYNCKGAYNDITHKHYFNETSFDNIVNSHNHYGIKKKTKFKIIKLELIPTRLGKIIYPKRLRQMVGLVLGEVFKAIDVELIVIK